MVEGAVIPAIIPPPLANFRTLIIVVHVTVVHLIVDYEAVNLVYNHHRPVGAGSPALLHVFHGLNFHIHPRAVDDLVPFPEVPLARRQMELLEQGRHCGEVTLQQRIIVDDNVDEHAPHRNKGRKHRNDPGFAFAGPNFGQDSPVCGGRSTLANLHSKHQQRYHLRVVREHRDVKFFLHALCRAQRNLDNGVPLGVVKLLLALGVSPPLWQKPFGEGPFQVHVAQIGHVPAEVNQRF
mmetsp:Transcript_23597/g.52291  ORF Transcript_23597/g.52291 Transcript_23597/m.52291 type:complete len:237 (-) Transcript_23597:2164-2874(-)